MANVNFKRGLQSTLNGMSTFDEGTFYLTTDTDRLYFAQASNELVPLNQFIHFWTGANLPTSADVTLENGDIYYWTNEEALLILDNKTTGKWIRLNEDTYLEANPGGAVSVTTGTTTGSVRVGTTVTDTALNTASGSFELIPGNANVTITNSGNNITISTANDNDNTTYTIGTQASVENSSTANLTLTPSLNGTAQTPQVIQIQGTGNTVVSSDASGHITINSSGGIDQVKQNFNTSGNLQTKVSLSVGGNLPTQSVTPIINYGENGTTPAYFLGATDNDTTGTATLSVYTMAEVDQKIEDALGDADALNYQGTVTQSNAATKLVSTANAGEVYKAGTDIELAGLVHVDSTLNGTAKAGDLIISSGTDEAVIWEVIPSGDDQNISVTIPNNDNTFKVYDNSVLLGGINVAGDNHHIGIGSTIAGGIKTYTISHLSPGTGTATTIASVVPAIDSETGNPNANATELTPASDPIGHSINIPVITSLSVDSYGHVVSSTGQTYKVWDTHGSITNMSKTISVTNNVATIVDNIYFDGQLYQTNANNSLKIATDQSSLQLTKPNDSTVKLELVWGTF